MNHRFKGREKSENRHKDEETQQEGAKAKDSAHAERKDVDFNVLTGCCFTDWPTVVVVQVCKKLFLQIPV